MSERQVLLEKVDGLVGVDLNPSYNAVNQGKVTFGVVPRFKKKEDVSSMAKSILKHKIQTLTGKNVKKIEEEMNYRPKDPNEPSMDIDTMRSLASFLILQSNGELNSVEQHQEEDMDISSLSIAAKSGRKRENSVEMVTNKPAKSGRRSLNVSNVATQEVKTDKKSRRSNAVLPDPTPVKSTGPITGRPGRRSLAVGTPQSNGTPKVGRRRSLATPVKSTANESTESLGISCVLAPADSQTEQLAVVSEEQEDQQMEGMTPQMKEMMKKRQSKIGTEAKSPNKKIGTPAKSPGKRAAPSRASMMVAAATKKVTPRPPSPAPRPEFIGDGGNKAYLLLGEPLADTKLSRVTEVIPPSAGFIGSHLTVLHTPADWTPHEVFAVGQSIKKLNKDVGLDNFSLLVGTGLENVHMNMEALLRHTKHVQFITFHREDANTTTSDTGKLRETTCFFLVAYFFPGCDQNGSVLPNKMVRDGYTTCFSTKSTSNLEETIVDCFSDVGEWVLDLCCGSRQLSVAAWKKGRCAIALDPKEEELAKLDPVLRDLVGDKDFRDKDGYIISMS